MKFKGNVDVDKRTIDLNLSIQKEEGEEEKRPLNEQVESTSRIQRDALRL